jgi:hypothetical protein
MIEGVSARDDASLAALEDSGGWRPVIETGGNEIATNEYQTLVEELQAEGSLTNGANVGEITGNANVGEITANGAGNTTGASFTDQPQQFTFARGGAAMEQPSGMLGDEPYDGRGGYSFTADQGLYGGGAEQQPPGAQAAATGGAALGTGPTTQQPQGALARASQPTILQTLPGDVAPNTQNPFAGENFNRITASPMTSDTDPRFDQRTASVGNLSPGKTFDPLADLQQPSGQNRIGLQPSQMPQAAQAPATTRGMGGYGGGMNTRLQTQPFSPSQGKGGFDMNAALSAAMKMAAASQANKQQAPPLKPGPSRRDWRLSADGNPGTPAGIAAAQQQGVLAQAALGGQTFSPVRPIMPSPYRRPAIA